MFESLFGAEMPLAARFFVAFLVVLALIGLTAWLVRRFGANRIGNAARGRQPRLAVIDAAQRNISDLTTQVSSLQGVLANKQQRGAFGQARMELIVQDGLPKGCYEFQPTLSNRTRPDCGVLLPDGRPLVIDAKFPLEAVTALREAASDEELDLSPFYEKHKLRHAEMAKGQAAADAPPVLEFGVWATFLENRGLMTVNGQSGRINVPGRDLMRLMREFSLPRFHSL